MAKIHASKLRDELEIIRSRNRKGMLVPEAVVAYARDPKTRLHACFEWDDTAAAQRYRIEQARSIIRVVVTVLPGTDIKTDAYVSLHSDRARGRGYRAIADVLSDAQLRQQMLDDAEKDLEMVRDRYNAIRELTRIIGQAVKGVRSLKKKK